MSFELARQLQEKAVEVMHTCRVLDVSRSGYYAGHLGLGRCKMWMVGMAGFLQLASDWRQGASARSRASRSHSPLQAKTPR